MFGKTIFNRMNTSIYYFILILTDSNDTPAPKIKKITLYYHSQGGKKLSSLITGKLTIHFYSQKVSFMGRNIATKTPLQEWKRQNKVIQFDPCRD